MVNIINPKNCCGCTACYSICTYDAISMKPDALGFLYPEVDTQKCVDCGLCENVCAFNDLYDTSLNLPNPETYGVRHKEMSQIMQSRSGAMFVAISDYILERSGVVYGAGYEGHFRVVHKRAITKEERDEFRGSKYVQSDLKDVFRHVKDDLKRGMTVLFSGTPCQTSGLNSYVGKKLRENLVLIDIVCHGVPSPYIWRDYIAYLEKKEGDVIVEVNFRDKLKFGWKAHRETFKFGLGETVRELKSTSPESYDLKVSPQKNAPEMADSSQNGRDMTINQAIDFRSISSSVPKEEFSDGLGGVKMFSYIFYKHIMFRHSCADCHFCNTRRPSDITLADFWHFENVDPAFNADDKGANLVLVNTAKGREIFEAVRDQLNVIPVDLEKCMQGNLRRPSPSHPQRWKFEEYYSVNGFEKTMKRFGFIGWRYRLALIKKKTITYLKSI